jgi:ABC-type transport system substrate-binding protein
MDTTSIKPTATGALLATITFILISTSFPAPVAAASGTPYFSFTMIAPNTNPVRVQWSEIIQNSYQTNGIAANLVFTSFGPLVARVWPNTCPTGGCGQLFNAGGYDAVFIGWGGGTVLPDWGTTNVVNYLSSDPASDFPNIGNNYAYWTNSTYNNLASQYATSFDVAQRESIAKQMVSIVAQQRPYLVIIGGLGATPDNPVAANVHPWNQQATWNTALGGNDFQHWALSGGATVINVGISADVSCQYNLPIGPCNSTYNDWLTSGAFASLEELDPRTLNYFDALANNIVSSSDHLTWTLSFKAHTFQDGVQVTANDYIFSYMFNLISGIGSVSLGTFQQEFGLDSQFNYNLGNGTTTDYIVNGTYYGTTQPAGFAATSTFSYINSTAFSFTMPAAYPFTDPTLTGVQALPMHVMMGFVSDPSSFATSWAITLNSAPTTVTWNTSIFGGNGSYSTFGLYGDGPYVWKGYDKVARVGTYHKWSGYWNATGLQNLGEFSATTVHIDTITGKDSALAAFGAGTVNSLDTNYQFDRSDANAITSAGGVNIFMNAPNNGWQELGLNFHDPIFGTGTGTPNGQTDPTHAAQYALDVRAALSYLIPRQQIVAQLLQGLGVQGITQFCTCFPEYMPAGLQPDPYNPQQALSFLAAAGYNTGVAPSTPGTTSGLGQISISIPASNVKVPGFLLGESFTLQGLYQPAPQTVMTAAGGYGVVLQQSANGNAGPWQAVAGQFADTGGYFSISYTPTTTGNFTYRLHYTGVNQTYALAHGYTAPAVLESIVYPAIPVVNSSEWKNSTAGYYGATSNFNVGTLGDVVSQLASGDQITALGAQLNSSLNSLASSINSASSGLTTANSNIAALQTSVNSLNSQVSTLSDVAYAAIAVAVILGLVAIALSRRKPSG